MAENMVLITRIWNWVMNSGIGYVYAAVAVNHYLKGFLTSPRENASHSPITGLSY